MADVRVEGPAVREGAWQVPPPPPGPVDRRVEITGPTQPKTAIDALDCRVNVWLADLEDASTPHWRNVVGGQVVRRVVAGEVAGIGALENQDDARRLFEQVAPADEFPDFLTLPAYELIV